MAFVKTVKTKAYFKRFQVALRRRREGKTDYHARRALVTQAVSKHSSPKYRLVVRFTNKRCIVQIASATLQGDRILAAASSDELVRYGVPVGLKNFAACYCTGLLLARRLLTKLNMADMFTGKEECDGEDFHIEDEYETDRRPFKALLDVGLSRTTTGHRVFAALKGAIDGGLHVPHTEKRFFSANEDGEVDAAALRARLLGGHVGSYMNELKEESEDSYQRQFSQYIKHGITADKLENMYLEAHKKIRADPSFKKVTRQHAPVRQRVGANIKTSKAQYPRPIRLTHQQRRERVERKIALALTMAA